MTKQFSIQLDPEAERQIVALAAHWGMGSRSRSQVIRKVLERQWLLEVGAKELERAGVFLP